MTETRIPITAPLQSAVPSLPVAYVADIEGAMSAQDVADAIVAIPNASSVARGLMTASQVSALGDAQNASQVGVIASAAAVAAIAEIPTDGLPGYASVDGELTFVGDGSPISASKIKSLSSLLAFYDFGIKETCELRAVSGGNPTVAGWTLVGLTASATAIDPQGLPLASALTESGTSVRTATFTASNTLGPGWVRMRMRYKPGAEYVKGKLHWRLCYSGGNVQAVQLPNLAALQCPDCDIATYTMYRTTGEGYTYGFQFTPRSDGWIDAVFETNVAEGGTWNTDIGRIDSNTVSTEARSGVLITVGPVTFEQDRVSMVSPASGSHDWSLYQPTALARPVRAPDIWCGSTGCLVEGYGNSCALSGALPSGTSYSQAAVVWVRQLRPAAPCQVMALTGVTASVSLRVTDLGFWQLVRTDDTGAEQALTTTHYVSPNPVAVVVTASATEVWLYVDGILASGGTMTVTGGAATITGHTLFGGDARTVAKCYAVEDSVLSAAEALSISTTLRSVARLPAKWPITIHTGQSNSTSYGGNSDRLPHQMFDRPGSAFWSGDYSVSAGRWQSSVKVQNGSAGSRLGYAQEAMRHGDYPTMICAGKGGEQALAWMSGGIMRDYLTTEIATALSQIGTHLYEITDWNWIQGEAEADGDATGYGDKVRDIRAWVRTTYGANVRFNMRRLNAWVTLENTGDFAEADTLRDEQDAVVADDPNTFVARVDGGALCLYTIHDGLSGSMEVGRALYRASRKMEPRVELVTREYPQRGTWTSGGYYDSQFGLNLAGNTWASREGGSVLTLTGAPTLTAITPKQVQFTYHVSNARETDAARWGAFNGSKTPIIAAIDFTMPSSLANTFVLMTLMDSTWGYRCIDSAFLSGLNLVTYGRLTASPSTNPVISNAVVASTRYTLVMLTNGTKMYTLLNGVLSIGLADSSASLSNLATLTINGNVTGQYGGSVSVRRAMIKTTTAANALAEAIELSTMLMGLG